MGEREILEPLFPSHSWESGTSGLPFESGGIISRTDPHRAGDCASIEFTHREQH